MAPKGTNMGLVLILVIMLWGETMAQSGCTTALIGLAPCLSFVSGNSSIPSASCCSQLSSVVDGQPRCLCSLLNGGGANLGISINQTKALSLPGACNVQTPPVSKCNDNGAANGPTSSVADSPTSNSPTDSSSNETPNAPTTTPTIPDVGAPTSTTTPTTPNVSSGGSKSVPSTKSDGSDATIVKAHAHVLVVALFIATCASITKF